MDGIILTTGVGGGSSSSGSVVNQATILPSDIESLDIYEANPCPSIKWLVSIHDVVTDDVTSFEIHALHDFNGNVCNNISSILRTSNPTDSIDYSVTVTAGPSADEILLAVENLGANTVDVCATRII